MTTKTTYLVMKHRAIGTYHAARWHGNATKQTVTGIYPLTDEAAEQLIAHPERLASLAYLPHDEWAGSVYADPRWFPMATA